MILVTNLEAVVLLSPEGEGLLTIPCSALLIDPFANQLRGFGPSPSWVAFRRQISANGVGRFEKEASRSAILLHVDEMTFELRKAKRECELSVEELPDEGCEGVWEILRRRVSEYWPNLYMPVLRWDRPKYR